MIDRPKYSLIEFERRWLVNIELLPDISGLEKIQVTDKYFPDTRMRLREMTDIQKGETVYKLTKKYGKITLNSEPLTTIYLSKNEFDLYNKINGYGLKKTLYRYPYFGSIFLIEFFSFPVKDLILTEAEAQTEEKLSLLKLPDFISREITTDKNYEGYSIASGLKFE
ncbi:MAG: hypothetical protein WAT71_09230 [Ignavibacteria bacterium]